MENGQLRGELTVKVGEGGLARLSSFENNQNDHNAYQLLHIKKPHCFPQLFENVFFFYEFWKNSVIQQVLFCFHSLNVNFFHCLSKY